MTKTFWAIIIMGVLVILSPFMDGIAGADEVKQIGIMANGPVFEITEANGYIYAGQGGEIHVYDGTTRDKILQLNWSSRIAKIHEPKRLGRRIRDLYVNGNYLYGSDDGEFFIADITNPASPFIVGALDISSSSMAISSDGRYAYFSGNAGVQVVDTIVKTNPVIVATAPEGTRGWRMSVSGDRLYVVRGSAFVISGNPSLMIFDISDPKTPILRNSFEPGIAGGYTGVDAKGNYIFAVDYYHWVHVIDASNAANPVIVANITGVNGTVINANDIIVRGNYLYVSTRYEGFRIYDITDPMAPVYLGKGKSQVGGYTEGIFADGDYVYLGMESMGTEIYDISNKVNPLLLMHIFTMGGADGLDISENAAFIGAHNDGVWVVDVTDPTRMNEIAFTYNGGRNTEVAIDFPNLYVAGGWVGTGLMDVSGYTPKLVWDHFGPSSSGRVKLSADKKFIYTPFGIVNVSIPSVKPKGYENGNNTVPWLNYAVNCLYGENYVISSGPGGYQIVDVSDKKNPVLMSEVEPTGAFGWAAVSGNTLVTVKNNAIATYDLSDVRNPRLIKRFGISGWTPSYVVVVNGLAYVSGGGTEPALRVFDIATNMTQVGTGDTGVSYSDGKYLYGHSKFGIGVYTLLGEPVPTPLLTSFPTLTTIPTTPPTPKPTPTPIPTPIPGQPPFITSLSPASASPGSNNWITISGGNFYPASQVKWDGSNRSTRYTSAAKIAAYIALGSAAKPGTANITVLNPDGMESSLAIFTIAPKTTPTLPPTTTEPTTTIPTTEITTIPTTEPVPTTTPPICTCPTPTPQRVCLEISETGMRLIQCPVG